MRVLHLIETLGKGGAEQSLVNLLPELKSLDIDVEVGVLWGPYDLQGVLEDAGIQVHKFDFPKRSRFISSARTLREFVSIRRYDVIHAHLLFPGLYAWLAGLGHSFSRCVTFHNLAYAKGCNPDNLKFTLVKQLNGLAMRRGMDGYIAVSSAVATHYQEHLRLPAITVIPNAFPYSAVYSDFSVDRRATRSQYDIDDDLFLIVMPGRLVKEKGHKIFLESLKQVLAGRPGVRALIIGDGPLKEKLRMQITDADLTDQVTLRGAMPQMELLQLVAAADLFVSPSLFEGFGLAVGEAMALGTPVIATQVGGLVDLIEDGVSGILVPSDDPYSLAKAMTHLMNNPDYAEQLSVAGKERIAAFFDAPVVADRMKQFYQELLGARK